MMTEFLAEKRIGCCFLSVKPDAPFDYARICRKAGRSDVKLFVAGETKFNFLLYELTRAGGTIESAALLFEQMDELQAATKGGGGKEESFWSDTRREALIHSIGACFVAFGKHLTIRHVHAMLSDAPSSLSQVDATSQEWYGNKCRLTLEMAAKAVRTAEHERRVREAYEFFTRKIPAAGEKVVGATTMHCAALLANFTRGKLYDTFCCSQSDHTPDWDLEGGITIFTDSVHEGKGFQFGQMAYSQILTRAALARPVNVDTPIVVICADEYQLVAAPQADSDAATQGRSQRLARVCCIQGISTLLNAMQDGLKAKYQAHTLLSNFNTKLFLQNSDMEETGSYFEKLCGQMVRTMVGSSQNPVQQNNPYDVLGVGNAMHVNFHEQLLPRKLASALTRLKSGGKAHGFVVTGYVHQTGTLFENGLPFKTFAIAQDLS
ncbi:MAG: TraM recognition domain-containing protein [Planctomycetales bacterium]|nr:TraM recognition domain-containing protein [Planctomycetales bacterium]